MTHNPRSAGLRALHQMMGDDAFTEANDLPLNEDDWATLEKFRDEEKQKSMPLVKKKGWSLWW
jgi:hypothetical protein